MKKTLAMLIVAVAVLAFEPFRRARMEGDKLSGSGRSKSGIEDRGRDLFKGRFYMIVAIMCRVPCVQPGVISGTFEQRGITRGGDF